MGWSFKGAFELKKKLAVCYSRWSCATEWNTVYSRPHLICLTISWPRKYEHITRLLSKMSFIGPESPTNSVYEMAMFWRKNLFVLQLYFCRLFLSHAKHKITRVRRQIGFKEAHGPKLFKYSTTTTKMLCCIVREALQVEYRAFSVERTVQAEC